LLANELGQHCAARSVRVKPASSAVVLETAPSWSMKRTAHYTFPACDSSVAVIGI